EFGKLGKLAAARMHEKIAVADTRAAGSRSDTVAGNPEERGKHGAAAKVLDRSLRFRHRRYRNDLRFRLHDFEHLRQGFAPDEIKPCVKPSSQFGYVVSRIIDHFIATERAHQRFAALG